MRKRTATRLRGQTRKPKSSRSAGLSQRTSIKCLRKYVDGTLHRLDTNPKFHNKEDAANARQAAEEALEVYKKLWRPKPETAH